MWTTDSYFTIGKSHDVCQDYAAHNEQAIFVSDGCSSVPDTDIGARLLVQIAQQVLARYLKDNILPSYNELGAHVITRAQDACLQLQISDMCLYATLIVAFEYGEHLYVYMYGDGTVIHNDKTYSVVYSENSPYYLNYWTGNRTKEFDSLQQQVKILETDEVIDCKNITWKFNLKDTKAVLITTDGIDTFIGLDGTVDRRTVAEQLLDVKNLSPNFMKRRVKRMLKNFAAEETYNFDDLGVAAVFRVGDQNG